MYFESFTQRDTKINVQGLNPHLMSALVNNFNLSLVLFLHWQKLAKVTDDNCFSISKLNIHLFLESQVCVEC